MPSVETPLRLNPSSSNPSSSNPSSSSSLRSRLHLLLPLLLSALLLTSSNMPPLRTPTRPSSVAATTTTTTHPDSHLDPAFSLRLFAHLAALQPAARNPVLSPLSLAHSLALLQHAVTKPGPAHAQLDALLPKALTTISSDDSFQLASSVWTSSSINTSFSKAVSEHLAASVHPLPTSVDPINHWVSQQTNAQIPALLTELPQSVIALLLSVVHFRASWNTRFDTHLTKPRSFQAVSQQLPFMHAYDTSYNFASIPLPDLNLRPKMLLLPYASHPRFRAVFLVPRKEDPQNALDTILSLLKTKPQLWSQWLSTTSPTELEVLAIPRFRLDQNPVSIKPLLNSVNVSEIFTPNPMTPPLARLTQDPNAFVDDLLQKVVVECNEEGTQMSAASAVVIKTRSLVLGKPSFVADRPFLFAISDSLSPHLLLVARVDRPDLS